MPFRPAMRGPRRGVDQFNRPANTGLFLSTNIFVWLEMRSMSGAGGMDPIELAEKSSTILDRSTRRRWSARSTDRCTEDAKQARMPSAAGINANRGYRAPQCHKTQKICNSRRPIPGRLCKASDRSFPAFQLTASAALVHITGPGHHRLGRLLHGNVHHRHRHGNVPLPENFFRCSLRLCRRIHRDCSCGSCRKIPEPVVRNRG